MLVKIKTPVKKREKIMSIFKELGNTFEDEAEVFMNSLYHKNKDENALTFQDDEMSLLANHGESAMSAKLRKDDTEEELIEICKLMQKRYLKLIKEIRWDDWL